MKKRVITALLTTCLLSFTLFSANAGPAEDPGNYISSVSNALVQMNKTYMSYISAAAHSNRAKKIEKLRQQALDAITNSKYAVIDLPIYKGDNSLRKTAIDYIQLCYKVFNEDYAHIVNMEEIAEQSVDEMQAYLLLQEKTNETLSAAFTKMDAAVDSFASKYNVKLIETKNPLAEKMAKASEVNHYHNLVYILFFKCNWQEGQMLEAMNKKKLNDLEQSRSALIKYATEGLATLDTLKKFEGDATLINACKTAMTFYKKEAETEMSKLSDFLIKEEEFGKLKKSFDAKSDNNKTKDDVDNYNKSITALNAAVNVFNQTNQKLNGERTQTTNNWSNASSSFMNVHIP